MIKKLFLISILFLTPLSCGFKPIFINQSEYLIKINESVGDNKLNYFIKNELNRYSNPGSNEIIDIKINSNYSKNSITKDLTGNTTEYQLKVAVKFEITRNSKTSIIELNEKINFKNTGNKFNLQTYEDNLIKNLTVTIVDNLIVNILENSDN